MTKAGTLPFSGEQTSFAKSSIVRGKTRPVGIVELNLRASWSSPLEIRA